MKKNILFLLFTLLTGVVIFCSSCKKDDSNTNNNNNNNNGPRTDTLHVLVHTGTSSYIPNVDVKLYISQHARDIDSAAAYSGKTDASAPSTKGAVFFGITPRTYYIKANYNVGGDFYVGTKDVAVTANTTVKVDIQANKTFIDGNLRVFVQYNTAIFAGAEVKLFLSDADRTKDSNVYLQSTTSDNGIQGVFALFNNLPFANTYFIKATYHDNGTGLNYMGTEANGTGVVVPRNNTKDLHILTTII